jgi:hypothetical protein
LQVANNNSFTSVVVDSSLGSIDANVTLNAGVKYFWRVRANNSAGDGSWSSIDSLTTQSLVSLPGVPALVSPSNYTLNAPVNLTLSWTAGIGATSSEVELSNDSTFATSKLDTSLINSTLSVANLANAVKYFWRARSDNSAGYSGWTAPWNFTTINNVILPYVARALSDTTTNTSVVNIVLSPDVTQNIAGTNVAYTTSASSGSVIIRNDSLIYTPNGLGTSKVTLEGVANGDTAETSANVNVVSNAPSPWKFLSMTDSIHNKGDSVIIYHTKSTDANNDKIIYSIKVKNIDDNSLDTIIISPDTSISIAGNVFKSGNYSVTGWATNGTDTTNASDTLTNTITGVKNNPNDVPKGFVLYQNYPNPFNPSTTIEYQIPKPARVKLEVYNVLGELVRSIDQGMQSPGKYSEVISGSNLPSGLYFYRIIAGNFINVKKFVLLK